MNRIVISGMGCLSAIGNNVSNFWSSLCEGKSGIKPFAGLYGDSGKQFIGAPVPTYNPTLYFSTQQLLLLEQFSQFALIATREAVVDAGIEFTDELRQKIAVILGTSYGAITSIINTAECYYEHNKERVHPLTIPKVMINAAISHITMEYKLHGPAYIVSTACASANHAIINAFLLVKNGITPIAIAGGVEACFSLPFLKAWEALRVLAPDTCRPFSIDRQGLVLGEGAGILVIESENHAKKRNAQIYAELAGYGMSSDAEHITKPSINGEVLAMQGALSTALVNTDEVSYVNAHGTGTRLNDSVETSAIHKTFHEYSSKLAVSSTKSMHGHALGAGGALEAIATVLAIKYNVAPPTTNFTQPDPDCDLDYIPNKAREMKINVALSNSFGFGGLNAVLAFRKY